MRKLTYILSSLCMLMTLETSAQNKLDNNAINMLEEYKARILQNNATNTAAQPRQETGDETVCATVILGSDSDVAAFETLGLDIFDITDNMLIADIPMNRVEEIAALDYVRHISFGRKAQPLLDRARAVSEVDAVHSGEDLETSYNGTGVVTALFDTGLDPNHINFKDDGGTSRVAAIATVLGRNAAMTTYETSRRINGFSTENSAETHGTHVLGIMSGSYSGEGTTAYGQTTIPFYGVATGSDIVVTCGDLYDNNILKGVNYAIQKATAAGKPAVINLSIGSNSGPHDGSDSFSKYLDSYGKQAIIVVAAGNEGDIPMGIAKKFTSGDNTLKTFIQPHVLTTSGTILNTSSNYQGRVEFYSNDNKPFKLKIVICNRTGTTISGEYEISASTSGKKTYIGGSAYPDYQQLTNFDSACSKTSYMEVSSNVSTDNNRYCVTIDHYLDMSSASTRYYLGFIIEGAEGQNVNGYATGFSPSITGIYSEFTNRGLPGWQDGSCDGTINSMACGKNVIAIGSYNTRKSWQTLSGMTYTYTGTGMNEKEISGFSSYGTLYDGRTLPDICAPGAGIISSYSTYYINNGKGDADDMSAKVSSGSRNNYWGNMQGTSMAAPFAAGTFALWLEADPTLTVDEVRDIATTTAIKDSYVTSTGSSVQWGAGKLDALAGIKEVLRRNAGVGSIMADDDSALVIRQTGNRHYEIFVAGEPSVTATLYNVSGAEAATVTADGDTVTLDASAVTPGVYILAVDGRCSRLTRKIVIR